MSPFNNTNCFIDSNYKKKCMPVSYGVNMDAQLCHYSLNMDAPLLVRTEEEQRAVIQFLWLEGVSVAEIHWWLLSQCGDSALLCRSVYKWIDMFKCGRK